MTTMRIPTRNPSLLPMWSINRSHERANAMLQTKPPPNLEKEAQEVTVVDVVDVADMVDFQAIMRVRHCFIGLRRPNLAWWNFESTVNLDANGQAFHDRSAGSVNNRSRPNDSPRHDRGRGGRGRAGRGDRHSRGLPKFVSRFTLRKSIIK